MNYMGTGSNTYLDLNQNTAISEIPLQQETCAYNTSAKNQLSSTDGTVGGFRFTTNNGDSLEITKDGYVSIGTTTPAYALDVNGDIRIVSGRNFIVTEAQR
ncbi:hypothetical protein IPM65_03410 [Candidatus Roizmanbacteria bacterium]|nr:MAG: hypothetical protein IPM65_03410 [Candidatus Roizmanbacteria bacterium]